VSVKLSLYS